MKCGYFYIFAILILTTLCPIELESAVLDLRYYDELSRPERSEIHAIKRNYHRYGPTMREIAVRRLNELRIKLLPEDMRVAILQKAVDDSTHSNQIPINVLNIIQYRQQNYMSLDKETRKQLIEFNLGFIKFEELTESARDFLFGQNLLIKDNLKS